MAEYYRYMNMLITAMLLYYCNSETMCTCQKVAKAFNQKFQQHHIGQTLNVSYRSLTFLIIYWTGLS